MVDIGKRKKKLFKGWGCTKYPFWCILLFLLFSLTSLFGEEVKISAEIDNAAEANAPLKGTITVTHNKTNLVDASSFRLDNKPLKTSLVREVQIDSNNPLVITIYSFELPPQPKGLYFLPAVTVNIGNKTYRSTMTSYEVRAASQSPTPTPSPAPSAPAPSTSTQTQTPVPTPTPASPPPSLPTPDTSASAQPILRLEAGIEGNDTLYPGQRTKFVYRYYYVGNIKLTKEELPLLDAKGLIKIGEKVINQGTHDNFSITEIIQEVEASEPGTFTFGPSLVEGVAVNDDGSTKKLSSEAPAVTLKVVPFTGEGKPASFNGAIGNYRFSAALISPSTVNVGDEISVALEITGTGNIKGVPLPDVSKQPGFEGFFRFDDLPPTEEVQGDQKKAILVMRPLSEEVKEIPSIEFSFFNPDRSHYVTVHSDPIPIVVEQRPAAIKTKESFKKSASDQPKATAIEQQYTPKPIEIEGAKPLDEGDIHNKPFGTWWAFGIIPFGIAVWMYQLQLRSYLMRKQKTTPSKSSKELLKDAFKSFRGSSTYYDKIQQAIKQALFEGGHIPSPDVNEEQYPVSGISEEAKQLMKDIEAMRYGGQGALDDATLRAKASDLVERLTVKRPPIPMPTGVKR